MNEEILDKVCENLGELMPLFFRKLVKPIDQQAKNFMSPMQVQVLFLLSKIKVCTMTELSNEMKVSKQQMSPVVDKLINNGFVHREHYEVDRRTVRINITQVGIAFLNELNKEMFSTIKEKISCIDKNDLIYFNTSISNLIRIIDKIP